MNLNEIINKSLKLINNKNFSEALDLLNQISVKDHQVFFIRGSIYILLNNLNKASRLSIYKCLSYNDKQSRFHKKITNNY